MGLPALIAAFSADRKTVTLAAPPGGNAPENNDLYGPGPIVSTNTVRARDLDATVEILAIAPSAAVVGRGFQDQAQEIEWNSSKFKFIVRSNYPPPNQVNVKSQVWINRNSVPQLYSDAAGWYVDAQALRLLNQGSALQVGARIRVKYSTEDSGVKLWIEGQPRKVTFPCFDPDDDVSLGYSDKPTGSLKIL